MPEVRDRFGGIPTPVPGSVVHTARAHSPGREIARQMLVAAGIAAGLVALWAVLLPLAA